MLLESAIFQTTFFNPTFEAVEMALVCGQPLEAVCGHRSKLFVANRSLPPTMGACCSAPHHLAIQVESISNLGKFDKRREELEVLQLECQELQQRLGATAADSHAAASEEMGVALNGAGSGTSLEDRLEVAKTRAAQIEAEVSRT